jgi:type 1 glutamine amidotransferase
MSRISAIALAIVFLCRSSVTAEDAKILFIGKDPDHPYGSHMYMHTCGMLVKCVERNKGATGVVSKGWPKDAKMLEGVQAIVVYTNPGAEFLFDSPDRDAIEALLKRGVGLVTIHWASSINQKNLERLGPLWLKYAGATWVSNVGLSDGKSPLKQLVPEHPICRGWKEYDIEDEYYMNPTIKDATPLLQVREKRGKDVIVGWAFDRPGGGRSFGTTLGHPYANFRREPFRRMIVNAILWSAHVEVPAAGADVAVDETILALPPKE